MNTMIIKSSTAIWSWDLETGKDCAHLAILGCIANPPVARTVEALQVMRKHAGELQAAQTLNNDVYGVVFSI